VGRFDVGALAIRQKEFGTVDATDALVARIAANVLQQSSVGMILTDGDPASNLDNSVAGVDFRYVNSRLPGGRSVEGEAWLQRSDSEGVIGDDSAYGFGLRFPSNSGLNGGLSYTEIENNFNPAMGFVRRTGVRDYGFNVRNTLRPQNSPIRTISSGINGDRIEYLDDGSIQSESLDLNIVNIDFNSQDSVSFGYDRSKEGLRRAFAISPKYTIQPGLYEFD
jgi:hypothetical protein